MRLQDVIHARDPQPQSQGAPVSCRQDPRAAPALGGRTPLRERLIVPWDKGYTGVPIEDRVLLSTGRRLAFPATFSLRMDFIDEARPGNSAPAG